MSMTPTFPIQIQGPVLWILGITFLAFLYVALTLYGVAFQPTSSQQAKVDPSPNSTSALTFR